METPRWKMIHVNETSLYLIEEEDKKYIASIVAVYIYDDTIQYRYCSQERLFRLIPVRVTLKFTEGLEILEKVCDRLYDRYGYTSSDAIHMGVEDVEKLHPKDVPAGDYDPADETEVVKYFQDDDD
jgi:hypothetical protein